MVVRSVATCMPAIPNTSKRSVILSAAVAGAAVSANIAATRQRRDRRGKRHRSGIVDTSQPCRGSAARQPRRRLDRVRGALLNARAGYGTGRVAQRESTPFTRVGSQVQSLSRPPRPRFIEHRLPRVCSSCLYPVDRSTAEVINKVLSALNIGVRRELGGRRAGTHSAAAVLAYQILRIRCAAEARLPGPHRNPPCHSPTGAPGGAARRAGSSVGYAPSSGGYLRVVLLSDGETAHNAFLDEDYE